MNPLTVRRLGAADVAAYRTLLLRAYTVEPDAFTSTPEERAAAPLSWWQQRIDAADGLGVAFGAFVDQRLVGSVTLEKNTRLKTRHKGHVVGVYVEAECRGLGAGKALMAALLAETLAQPDLDVLTLTVTQGNAAALRLYEGCGFVVFGVEPAAIRTPAGDLAKVHMVKLLRDRSGLV